MTPHNFVQKWKPVTLTEMSAYQQHFLDLCDLLEEKKPAAVDPAGESFTFQKGVTKSDGKKGWADVWRKGCFGWEYKGKHKDLKAAYEQLLKYREALQNPPLLIVCDMDRIEIHTNFPNTIKKVHAFDLNSLVDPKNIQLLHDAFANPHKFDPGKTRRQVTEEIAKRFARLTNKLQEREVHPEEAARFLIKVMFCMFAQDIGLLREGLFTEVLAKAHDDPAKLSKRLRTLFKNMATGGEFGADDILWFNGGLFADCEVIDLEAEEIQELIQCAVCDWSEVEPSIFGTLFERTLDPDKRAQIGAHYTDRKDIETILQPVLLDPLRREWNAVRTQADELWKKLQAANRKATTKKERGPAKKARTEFEKCVRGFYKRLTEVTILDPACGSGNFLYLALHTLLDLEKEAWQYGAARGITYLPHVAPDQLSGMEVNTYARELAQVVIWIGHLQWHMFNGFTSPQRPVLDAMESIRRMDAVLEMSDPLSPKEPDWPEAEFIVGNPPFLGDKKMRGELGDGYVDALRNLYTDRLPAQSDFCCYWFEKARSEIEAGRAKRAGLLATQGIRGAANRQVLNRIKSSGDIFFAISDHPWVLEGANVRVSLIGFDSGQEEAKLLNGKYVQCINENLTTAANVTQACALAENRGKAFIGVSMHGDFDFDPIAAKTMLKAGGNVNGRPNSDALRRIVNGAQMVKRLEDRWAVFFDPATDVTAASHYERPFEYIRKHVKPKRDTNPREAYRTKWWLHGEARPALLFRLATMARFIGTPRIAKHRIFFWMDAVTLPSDQIVAFTFSDDFRFGVLHSRAHEAWARSQGTQLRERESGFRYTPTSCFETFPFPEPFAALEGEISDAAKELDTLRNRWLNPPEWTTTEFLEFSGSIDGPWARFIAEEDIEDGIGTVRFPRKVPKNAECAAKLKARTLTSLYNDPPAWLDAVHKKLDELVFAAYGWSPSISDDELLAKLLELNLSRPAAGAPAEVDEDIEPAAVTKPTLRRTSTS